MEEEEQSVDARLPKPQGRVPAVLRGLVVGGRTGVDQCHVVDQILYETAAPVSAHHTIQD